MKCWLDIFCAGSNQEINKRSWWSKADFSWATATQDRWVIQRWNRTVPGSRDNPRTLPLSLQYNFMAFTIYNVSTVTMCNIPATLWELTERRSWTLQCLTNLCKVSIALWPSAYIHMALVYTILYYSVNVISEQITRNGKSSWKVRLQSFVEHSLSLASTLHQLYIRTAVN